MAVGHDHVVRFRDGRPRSDRPRGIAIRTGRRQAVIAVKRAIILLRFDWLTGLIGALLWWLGAAEARFGSCPAGGFARAGLRWCGGWRRITSEDPHDEIQTKIQVPRLDSLGCTNDQQI